MRFPQFVSVQTCYRIGVYHSEQTINKQLPLSLDMGKLLYMKIILSNNSSGVYFGGDVVEGRLLVGFSGDGKKARGI